MSGPVEIRLPQFLNDISDGVLAEQHRTKNGLLGSDVLGRQAIGATVRAAVGGMEFGDAHELPFTPRFEHVGLTDSVTLEGGGEPVTQPCG